MAELIGLESLIKDYTVYPRDRIVETNVTNMIKALEVGIALPPIVVDRATLRIVDGFHRFEAHRKFFGPDSDIAVEFEEHDDASLFIRAMETNTGHGVSLSQFDKVKCVKKGESFGITRDVIANALGMTRERLEGSITRKTSGDGEILKRTVGHFSGKPMTQSQKAFNVKAGGMDQKFYIDQVTALLESNSINWDNENVMESLQNLSRAMDKTMAVSA